MNQKIGWILCSFAAQTVVLGEDGKKRAMLELLQKKVDYAQDLTGLHRFRFLPFLLSNTYSSREEQGGEL